MLGQKSEIQIPDLAITLVVDLVDPKSPGSVPQLADLDLLWLSGTPTFTALVAEFPHCRAFGHSGDCARSFVCLACH